MFLIYYFSNSLLNLIKERNDILTMYPTAVGMNGDSQERPFQYGLVSYTFVPFKFLKWGEGGDKCFIYYWPLSLTIITMISQLWVL